MHVQRFETEKAIAYVYYNNLPTKEDLEKACMTFMRNALKEKEEKEKQRRENREGKRT